MQSGAQRLNAIYRVCMSSKQLPVEIVLRLSIGAHDYNDLCCMLKRAAWLLLWQAPLAQVTHHPSCLHASLKTQACSEIHVSNLDACKPGLYTGAISQVWYTQAFPGACTSLRITEPSSATRAFMIHSAWPHLSIWPLQLRLVC